jgi:hypothetical protein
MFTRVVNFCFANIVASWFGDLVNFDWCVRFCNSFPHVINKLLTVDLMSNSALA